MSPLFVDGSSGEEELLRSCYRKSLTLAKENGIRSIAFPLISTGSFGYPKEEGMRIAVDEIHAFLLSTNMLVCLVVFDEKATRMGRNLYPDLEAYIDQNYVQKKNVEEYGTSLHADSYAGAVPRGNAAARKPGRHGFLQSVLNRADMGFCSPSSDRKKKLPITMSMSGRMYFRQLCRSLMKNQRLKRWNGNWRNGWSIWRTPSPSIFST